MIVTQGVAGIFVYSKLEEGISWRSKNAGRERLRVRNRLVVLSSAL